MKIFVVFHVAREIPGLNDLILFIFKCRAADEELLPVTDFPGIAQLGASVPAAASLSLVVLAAGVSPLCVSNRDTVIMALALHKRISEFVPYDRFGNWLPRSCGGDSGGLARKAIASLPTLISPNASNASHAQHWQTYRPQVRVVLDALFRVLARKFSDLLQ